VYHIRMICVVSGVYNVLVVKPVGKRPLGDLRLDGCIILRCIFGERAVYSFLVGKV